MTEKGFQYAQNKFNVKNLTGQVHQLYQEIY